MPDVLIRDVPESLLAALRARAAARQHSLETELLAILAAAGRSTSEPTPDMLADLIREALGQGGRLFTDSTPLLREDRER